MPSYVSYDVLRSNLGLHEIENTNKIKDRKKTTTSDKRNNYLHKIRLILWPADRGKGCVLKIVI